MLQLGVEPPSIQRCKGQPLEGICGEQHHGNEEHRDRQGHAGYIGEQRGVAARCEELRQRAEHREDERPEQERPLLTRPECRGEEHVRQVARGVGPDVLDVEVVCEQAAPERERGDRHREPHSVHRAGYASLEGRLPLPTAGESDNGAPQAHQERRPERKRAEEGHSIPFELLPPRLLRSGNRTWPALRWRGIRRHGRGGLPR